MSVSIVRVATCVNHIHVSTRYVAEEPVKDRERNLRIFRHESVDRPIWQPRLEMWYFVNQQQGTLPEPYDDMSLIEVYDHVGASIRPYWYYNPCVVRTGCEGVTRELVESTPKQDVTLIHTPLGTLRSVVKKTEESSLTSEFPVKTMDDLKVYEYIVRNQRYEFDMAKYAEAEEIVGDRGEPTIFNLRTPLMRLFIEIMGFETTILALYEFPEEMDAFIRLIEETDQYYIDMVKSSPLNVLNFGDNVDATMLPPPLMKKYTLPYYQQRTAELRDAGVCTFVHWDGALKGLLQFVPECGFDGFEALTPTPMGDVTIEEIHDALGNDYVLVDGLPATHFVEPFTIEDVEEGTRRILDLFGTNLILGVSDELPPGADMERVKRVSEIVNSYGS